MFIRTEKTDVNTQEYGGEFRRIYPWNGVVDTPWGSAFMRVAGGESSNPHSHDEDETFIFLSGTGTITVNDERREVSKGDVVYLPPFSRHFVENNSADTSLDFLCFWWGGEPASSEKENSDD